MKNALYWQSLSHFGVFRIQQYNNYLVILLNSFLSFSKTYITNSVWNIVIYYIMKGPFSLA